MTRLDTTSPCEAKEQASIARPPLMVIVRRASDVVIKGGLAR